MYYYRIRYEKMGFAVYLGHLDVSNMFERCFRREGIPLVYTSGYNPGPRLVFASPISVGFSSEYEILDIELLENIEIDKIMKIDLPIGFKIHEVKKMQGKDKTSLMSQITAHTYSITTDDPNAYEKLKSFLLKDEITWERVTKKTTRILNMRDFVIDAQYEDGVIQATLRCSDIASLNPEVFCEYMGVEAMHFHKKKSYIGDSEIMND